MGELVVMKYLNEINVSFKTKSELPQHGNYHPMGLLALRRAK
jgi:hypothetical protein